MVAQPVRPETLEEKIVYWTIASTWGLWLLGALYIVGAAIGYILLLLFLARHVGLRDDNPAQPIHVPFAVLLWCLGMAAMLLALVVGHLDFGLGMGQTIKSSIGWAKGWALLAVLPLAGALLAIRAAVVYRAMNLAALQTLLLIPVFVFAGLVGLPQHLYTSPLVIVGGVGAEFFDVTLYAIDDTTGDLRWRFFGPWSTATAFFAGFGLLMAVFDRSWAWKVIGVSAALAICWMAGSRSSIVALPVVAIGVVVLSHLHLPKIWFAAAFAVVVLVLSFDTLLMIYQDSQEAFNAARAASSRVRATLNHIGYHRWLTEAFWFGHGVVERGPHLVQFMPIGSHHTWYGLLFVKGLVGFLALAIPLAYTAVDLALKAQCDRVARCALGIVLAIVIFSFADNIEIVTYLIWPGLLLIGIALRRPFRNPYAAPLAGGRPRQSWYARLTAPA